MRLDVSVQHNIIMRLDVSVQHTGHGEDRNAYRILVRKPEEKDHLRNLGVDVRIILKWVSEISCEGVG
jgi:hypothetical protein